MWHLPFWNRIQNRCARAAEPPTFWIPPPKLGPIPNWVPRCGLLKGQCMCPKWVKDLGLLGMLNITALGAHMNGLFMFVLSFSIFFNEIRTYCKTCQRWQLDFAWFSHEALISAYVLFNFLSFVCRIGLSRLKKSRPYRPWKVSLPRWFSCSNDLFSYGQDAQSEWCTQVENGKQILWGQHVWRSPGSERPTGAGEMGKLV